MSTPKRHPVILDVDTGIDDAIAIALALRLPALEVIGLTTVSGNVGIDLTTRNSLRVLEWLGHRDVPVCRGMAGPLVRPVVDAAAFHGPDGLGGAEIPPAPVAEHGLSGPEFIVRSVRDRPGELTLICVGPLTNLAVALGLEPDLPRLARRVVVMGGAFTVPGNVTPHAEFNVYADPEAAAIVARSALPLTFIGLDVTHQVPLTRPDWESLTGSSAREARLVHGVAGWHFVERGRDQMFLHDPLAVAVAAVPDLVTTETWGVVVDASLSATAGKTLLVHGAATPGHQVALRVDTARFMALVREALSFPRL